MDSKHTEGKSEAQLIDELVRALEPDFEIRREVNGTNLLNEKRIRADIVAHARPHVLETGFADAYFAIEVKAIPSVEQGKKARDMAWQAVSYRLSRFDFGITEFVLLYPRLTNFYNLEDKEDVLMRGGSRRATEVETLLQRGNVGWIELHRGRPRASEETIIGFGGDRYWSSTRGLTKVKNFGTRLHIGTRR